LNTSAIVEEVHFLGADWRIRLVAPGDGGDVIRLYARGPGRPPDIGAKAPIFIPAEAIFMFPGDEGDRC
jgi:hypothetical protein